MCSVDTAEILVLYCTNSLRTPNVMPQDTDLWFALRGAGSSFAVVTEFLVRVWPRPETLPIIIPVSEQEIATKFRDSSNQADV